MEDKYRKSGIDTIGDIPWGTHACQLYQTKDDLIDILVPYFKAGLESNEFCLWVTSEPLGVNEAKAALGKAIRGLNDYISKGQIEILDYREWYTKSGKFSADEVLHGWVEKEMKALEKGFGGLRATGNISWLGAEDWVAFREYEAVIDSIIGEHRMIAICTYSLDRCEASEMLDVMNNHEVTLIKRTGLWKTVESDERKRLKKMLTASEVRFRRLFETAQDGILIIDADTGQITDSNPFIEGLLGYTAEELGGKNVWELGLFEDIAKSEDAFKELQREGYIRYEDLKLETRDGKAVDVEFISNVYDVERKKIIQCNIREISERKAAEEVSEQYKELLEELVKQRTSELAKSNRKLLKEITERKQAEKTLKKWSQELEKKVQQRTQELEERGQELAEANMSLEELSRHKSQFLTDMSHELRTPLNSIIGYTKLMLDGLEGEINEEQRQDLQTVYNNSKNLLSLINDLLDLAKIEAGKVTVDYQTFTVAELLDEVIPSIERLAKEKGLTLVHSVDPNIDHIYADKAKTKQTLINIIGNAVKFTEKGGVKLDITKSDGEFVFSVRDTGMGIKKEDLEVIFDSFKQVGPAQIAGFEGTGLGLAISKQFVEMQGGRIWAESQPGEGSTFTFTLPVKKARRR
jgi:PAS domain S-box-containing protein